VITADDGKKRRTSVNVSEHTRKTIGERAKHLPGIVPFVIELPS
jgi:hypothetical protein